MVKAVKAMFKVIRIIVKVKAIKAPKVRINADKVKATKAFKNTKAN